MNFLVSGCRTEHEEGGVGLVLGVPLIPPSHALLLPGVPQTLPYSSALCI